MRTTSTNLLKTNSPPAASQNCHAPSTNGSAVKAFAADPFVEEILGTELRNEFIAYKSEEWRQYHQRVSQWEIDTYARMF